jgi:hypothetical protein
MNTKKTETSNKGRGGHVCNHPSLAKEFILGLPTGDYVCAKCGQQLSSIIRSASR